MISAKQCLTLLDELGVAYELVEHKAVYTIAEAMQELPGRTEVKNLLLQDDKGRHLYLVMMPGLKKLDLKKLAADLGEKKVRFCNPQKVEHLLGVKPGSVSLFCCLHPNSQDIEIVFDKELLELPELGLHPIVNTATVFIEPCEVNKILSRLSQKHQML